MNHGVKELVDDSRGVAQPGSATVLGTVGREFESRRPDHKKIEINYREVPFFRALPINLSNKKTSFFAVIAVNKKIFYFLKIFVDPRVVYRASCMSGVLNINM